MSRRASRGAIALAAFAFVGAAISVYLTFVHYAAAPLACGSCGVIDCADVMSSAYSVLPGTTIPVTVPGMLWFAGSGALAVTAVVALRRGIAEPGWLRPMHLLWTVAGLVAVFYLVYGEISLRHICEWCTGVHLLVLASLLVAMARWQHSVSR